MEAVGDHRARDHGRRDGAQPGSGRAGGCWATTATRRGEPLADCGVRSAWRGRRRGRAGSAGGADQPALARGTARDGRGDRRVWRARRRVVVEASTMALEDKLRASSRLARRPGTRALDCPISGTGAQAKTQGPGDLRQRRQRRDRAAQPLFAAFARAAHDLGAFGNGSRMKYVANLLVAIHNVATRGGHGARHEGRARPAADLRSDRRRRRQFARVRTARADDGERQLRRRPR